MSANFYIHAVYWSADRGVDCRIKNCCSNNDIKTLADLCEYTPNQILAMPNMGKKSLIAIQKVLGFYGLGLKDTSSFKFMPNPIWPQS